MADHVDTITLQEAADRLGVHYMTAYRYVRTGRLPAERVGRQWQVDPADLASVAVGGTAADRSDGRPLQMATLAGRLEGRLLAGDEAGAWSVVEEALVGGLEPAQVLVELVGPAMASVGERWHVGEISIVDEHVATAVTTRLIGRLGPRFARRGPARATVVLGTPPGDHHALPTAILRDLLRGERIEAIDLGADVPAESWTQAVIDAAGRSPRLVAVGIAATSPQSEEAIATAVAGVRAAGVAVPILLGGSAIDDGLVESLGVELRSESASEAVAILSALASPDASTSP